MLGGNEMNLDDIPKIRAQFQPLQDRRSRAWKETDPRNPYSMGRWEEEFKLVRGHEEELCQKYFGHDLEIDGEFLEPLMVLDWIEHFMEVTCPKT
jgi:hypothetical protein